MKKPVLTRFEGNPILTPTKNWWEKKQVFNAGAVVRDNKIHLLYRAIGSAPVSNFGLAILENPTTVMERFSEPIFIADAENEYERLGIEDPRVVYIDGRYYIVYTASSLTPEPDAVPPSWSHSGTPWRIRLSMASTADFKAFTRHGVIIADINTKDGTLFPGKITGKFILLHRIFPDIWISQSVRVDRFEKGTVLCRPRPDSWDCDRIGAGGPPIKTELGWLLFYHGVESHPDETFIYKIGLLLLDLHDPKKILYRSDEPLLIPEKDYEREGNTKNVVFTCGAVEWAGRYYVYYGAGDSVVGVASIDKEELIDYLASKLIRR